MRSAAVLSLTVVWAAAARPAAAAPAKPAHAKKKAASSGGLRLNVDASALRAAGADAQKSLSGLGESTSGDRRKLGAIVDRLADSLRDAWRRLTGADKKPKS